MGVPCQRVQAQNRGSFSPSPRLVFLTFLQQLVYPDLWLGCYDQVLRTSYRVETQEFPAFSAHQTPEESSPHGSYGHQCIKWRDSLSVDRQHAAPKFFQKVFLVCS